MSSVQGMSSPLAVNSLDHVALWVADRDALADLACEHLGHARDRAHRRRSRSSAPTRGAGKLTLFAAEGPREPGALVARRPARRRPRRGRSRRCPPTSTSSAATTASACSTRPRGSGSGSSSARRELDYDLDHVVLRVAGRRRDARAALARARLRARRATRLRVGDKAGRARGRRRAGGRAPAAQPPRAARRLRPRTARGEAARRGAEVADVVDAANTLAVFVWGAGPHQARVRRAQAELLARRERAPTWSSRAPGWPASPRQRRRASAARACSISRRATAPGGAMLLSSGVIWRHRDLRRLPRASARTATRRSSARCSSASTPTSTGSSRSARG